MRAISLLFCLQIAVLFFGCKKDQEVIPELIKVGDGHIKSIRVTGAKEATLDTVRSYIQVVLPADYTGTVLDLELELGEGMKLGTPPDSALFIENHVRYNFIGIPPMTFLVSKAGNEALGKAYTIFVKHEGRLTAKLTSSLSVLPDNSSFADTSDLHAFGNFRALSGLGSIPDSPGGVPVISFVLEDAATGQRAGGSNNEVFPFGFEVAPVSKFLSATQMQLTMRYGDKEFRFPDVSKLEKSAASGRVYWYDKQWKNLTYDKPVTILGGAFLPEYQYQVTISNGRMTTPRTINARIKSFNQLVFDIPSDVPEDQYLVNIYQGGELIGNSTEAIAKDSTRMNIGRIWTEFSECPFNNIIHGNISKISLRKGQLFYAMPFAAIYSYQQGNPIDPNKPLPSLQLKSGNTTILLKPKVQADWCYGDGSIYLYYGAYTLPANILTGQYEARLVTNNGAASLPYWSLVDIQ